MNAERGAEAIPSRQPTSTVLLIRHGHTDAIGRTLVGRLPGVRLSPLGRAQAERLPARLAGRDIEAIYASPLVRTRETAAPLAAARALDVQTLDSLLEADFGEWTGLAFDALEPLDAWRRFNESRGTAPVPGGETALEAQARIVGALDALRLRHAGSTIAVFSHADPIRYAVLHYASMPLDDIHQVTIDPASVTIVRFDQERATLVAVNEREDSIHDVFRS